MKTEKLVALVGDTAGELEEIAERLEQVVDGGIATQPTGHALEAAAGACHAAIELVRRALAECPPGGNVP